MLTRWPHPQGVVCKCLQQARQPQFQQQHALASGLRTVQRRLNPICSQVAPAGSPDDAPDSKPPSVIQRVRKFFVGEKLDKARMAELGIGFTASYGLLSNLVYVTGMSITWVIYVRRYSKTPLFPGEWKAFLLFYAGFWTINNFIRPLRVAMCISAAPIFDTAFNSLAERFGVKKRTVIVGYFIAVAIGTFALLFGVIALFGGPHAFAREPWV